MPHLKRQAILAKRRVMLESHKPVIGTGWAPAFGQASQ